MKKYFLFFILLFSISQSSYSQQWNDVGGGADARVEGFYLDTNSNQLFVGGGFNNVGTISAHKIAVWDGSTWSPLGANENFSPSGSQVMTIVRHNGDLIVAGYFDSIGGVKVNNIARWDGVQWNAMGNGFNDLVDALQVYNGELYAGGQFLSSGNDTLHYIAKWNGSTWLSLDKGLSNAVVSMCLYNNLLIIGGAFLDPIFHSGLSARILGWDGSNWIAFDKGFNGSVLVVKNINDTLYAGGQFTAFGLYPSNYISKWDGSAWQPMPYPTGGSQPWVTDIVSYSNDLYLCGYFKLPPDLVKFNGAGYDSVGKATGFFKKMIAYKNELYVGGSFLNINSIPLTNIARYNLINGLDDQFLIQKDEAFIVYPNPISKNEELNIQLTDKITSSSLRLRIYDYKGVCVYENKQFKKSPLRISDQLHAGFYFIIINDEKKNQFVKKLIVN